MSRARSSMLKPLGLSLALHLALVAGTLVEWPWGGARAKISVTPVTLLTAEQLEALSAADQSDTPEDAATEDPVIEAPPEPPAPQPTPAPPTPAPTPPAKAPPTPQPKPAPKTAVAKAEVKAPAPKTQPQPKATPAPKESVNLDQLYESIAKNARPSGAAKSAAPKGPTRAQSDLQERLAEGAAKAATDSALLGLGRDLERLWNHNCGVQGAKEVRLRMRMHLARDGSLTKAELIGYPDVNEIANPVVRAAATRALNAASTGSPYRSLPNATYDTWKSVIIILDGRNVCD